MKRFLFILLSIFLFSCRENKERGIEFIPSNTMSLILIKNPPENDSILKLNIKEYLENNFPKKNTYLYIYNDDTSYFINHKEDDEGPTGFYFLYNYRKTYGIGQFFVEGECPNQWGELRYYDKYGNFYEPDTIIGKCK